MADIKLYAGCSLLSGPGILIKILMLVKPIAFLEDKIIDGHIKLSSSFAI